MEPNQRAGSLPDISQLVSWEKYPETELLKQVKGVGDLTALTYVLTIVRRCVALRDMQTHGRH